MYARARSIGARLRRCGSVIAPSGPNCKINVRSAPRPRILESALLSSIARTTRELSRYPQSAVKTSFPGNLELWSVGARATRTLNNAMCSLVVYVWTSTPKPSGRLAHTLLSYENTFVIFVYLESKKSICVFIVYNSNTSYSYNSRYISKPAKRINLKFAIVVPSILVQ